MGTDTERPPTTDEAAGMVWWNSQTELVRAFWLRLANSARAADAWAAYRFLMLKGSTDEQP